MINEKYVVRFFGDFRPSISISDENLICSVLAAKNLGPMIYGTFDGGRLEEFISGKCFVKPDELKKLHRAIGSEMRNIHRVEMPLRKDKSCILEIMNNDFEKIQNTLLKQKLKPLYENAKKVMETTPQKLVFCHNDIHHGNFIVGDSGKVTFIDFEFSGYNFPAFDIANYFNEIMFEYSPDISDGFKIDESKYPDKREQIEFLEAYLRTDIVSSDWLKEIEKFRFVSHVFWTIRLSYVDSENNEKTGFNCYKLTTERLRLINSITL